MFFFFFEREKKIKFRMNFSSKGNTYPFIFFYSFTIENMFKYQCDYNYTSSILSSFFSILDSSIHKEIFEPNRKANKQKKKGRSVSTESLCTMKRRRWCSSTDIFQWSVAAIFSKRRYVPNHRKVPSVLSKTIGRIIVYRDAGRS